MLLDIDGNLKRVSYLHLHPVLLPTNEAVTCDLRPTTENVTSDSQPSNNKVTSDSPAPNIEATSDLRLPINEMTSDSQDLADKVTSDSQEPLDKVTSDSQEPLEKVTSDSQESIDKVTGDSQVHIFSLIAIFFIPSKRHETSCSVCHHSIIFSSFFLTTFSLPFRHTDLHKMSIYVHSNHQPFTISQS